MRRQMSLSFLKTVNLTVITVVALAPGACRLSNVGEKAHLHKQKSTVVSFGAQNGKKKERECSHFQKQTLLSFV